MEKELLAIYKGLEFFKHSILGYKINVITVNRNPTYERGLNKRVHRWRIAMSEFNIQYRHVKGRLKNAVDYLSRDFMNTAIEEGSDKDYVIEFHSEFLHPGISKMYMTLKNLTKIKKLKKIYEEFLRRCWKFQQEKNFSKEFNSHGSLHTQTPGEKICADIFGPFT